MIIMVEDDYDHKFSTSSHHPIPASFCSAGASQRELSKFLTPIMNAHHVDIYLAAPFQCLGCGQTAHQLIPFWFNNLDMEEPSVHNHCVPVCQPRPYETRGRQRYKAWLRHWERLFAEADSLTSSFTIPCAACHESNNTKQCSRCKQTYYCSVKCQRLGSGLLLCAPLLFPSCKMSMSVSVSLTQSRICRSAWKQHKGWCTMCMGSMRTTASRSSPSTCA